MNMTNLQALALIALTVVAAAAAVGATHLIPWLIDRYRRPRLVVRAECLHCDHIAEFTDQTGDPANQLDQLRHWMKDHEAGTGHQSALVVDTVVSAQQARHLRRSLESADA